MQLVITENDYSEALGSSEAKVLAAKRKEEVLGPESNNAIVDALPKVLADRVKKMIPENYEIKEISIKITISGTPFGVGLAGDASVKFGPAGTS